MREILFRGKRVDNGEWVYSSFIMQDKEHKLMSAEVELFDGEKWRAVDPETVGQFIGLTDKNGKKIFEGDIVVTRFTTGQICAIGDIQFACGVYGVEWTCNKKNKGMIGCFGQAHNLRKLDDDIINNIEIIGNIHDNPELLED